MWTYGAVAAAPGKVFLVEKFVFFGFFFWDVLFMKCIKTTFRVRGRAGTPPPPFDRGFQKKTVFYGVFFSSKKTLFFVLF